MKNEEFYNSLSEEVKQKLAGCRTAEEAKKVLSEAGVEPLDDKLLDEAAGGWSGGTLYFPEGPYKPSVIA